MDDGRLSGSFHSDAAQSKGSPVAQRGDGLEEGNSELFHHGGLDRPRPPSGSVASPRAGPRQSFGYTAVGILAGLAAAVAGSRLMSGLLFGVTSTDSATFASATAAVLLAALAATAIPAWRAARTTPVSALRVE
jgi:hypothetical protein